MPDPLMEIQNLSVRFGAVEAVSGLSLSIERGEVVAVVGESGSGKTVTALTITRLLASPPVSARVGRILFNGQDLLAAPEDKLQACRGARIAYIFQEPASALNPVFTAGYQIGEALRQHGRAKGREQQRILSLLLDVGIREPERVARAYPHQLSGGQQQRVMIAMALACEPDLLIADEPTTALDVTVQAQILELLKKLQREHGMAVLLITHNLAIAANMADRIAVMYAGELVEVGRAEDVVKSPRHPYTRALLKAVPRMQGASGQLQGIPGQIPSANAWPSGCRFHPRCPIAQDRCRGEKPDMMQVEKHQRARCFFAGQELST